MPSDDFWADVPDRPKGKPVAPTAAKRSSSRGVEEKPKSAEPLIKKKLIDTTIKVDIAPAPTQTPVSIPVHHPRAPWVTVGRVMAVLLLMLLGAASGVGLLILEGLTAQADSNVIENQIIEIPKGTSSRAIAEELEEKGLIISQWPFLAYLKINQRLIRAGVYSLNPAMTTKEIVDQMAGGETAAHRVTIPEGWRLEQIADLFEKAGVLPREEFLRAAQYDPVRYVLPPGITLASGDSLEGLLYPDTYEFAYGVTAKEVVATLLNNFDTKTADLSLTYDQIILASIIEREAKYEDDRALIGGVYSNRLKTNLRLEADPTVQYGRDNLVEAANTSGEAIKWWSPITVSDYQSVKSTYNTYLISGLPPGPIANPGRASLTAAINPTVHDYYFFLSLSDGTTVYSKTKAQHDAQKAAH